MPTAQWSPESNVMQRLLNEPYRFQFLQAVRLITQWLCQNGVPHDRAIIDYLRFHNSVSLNFPASQIEALEPEADTEIRTAAGLTAAVLEKQFKGIAITPTFMGYLGANGALPIHFTERIASAQHFEKNEGPRAFLDLYSSRALALFYRACEKYRVEFKRDMHGGDGYLPLLLLLAGGTSYNSGVTESSASTMHPETPAYYATVIRQRMAAGGAIADVLVEYFGVPFTIEPFDGCWDPIPEPDRFRLGGPNAVLGGGATLGERRWTRELRVRIKVGPLTKKDFNKFAGDGTAARALKSLLSMFPCAPIQFRVQLSLRAQDVTRWQLGSRKPGQLGLGLDSFLVTNPVSETKDHYQYDLKFW